MAEETLDPPEEAQIDASVATLMADLPKPVQEFLSGPERDATSLRLTQRYGLHADQAAKFEMAFIYMLLGVSKPEEFVADLREAGLPAETIKGLANDVNEEVFKPLQQKEHATYAPAAPIPAQQIAPPPQPVALPVPPAPIRIEQPDPQISVPQPVVPVQQNPLQVPAPTPIIPSTVPEPEVRTMAGDIAMVKSGTMHIQQPSPEPARTAPPVIPPQPAPALVIRSVPPPISMTHPSTAPVQTPPLAPPTIRPAPKAAPTQSENRDALHAILKEYGVDPYREPIDE